METCDKGYQGDCCCLCDNQAKIEDMRTSKNIGWGCLLQIKYYNYDPIREKEKIVYSSKSKHGACEGFSKREGI